MVHLTNVQDGLTVYQRSLLLIGREDSQHQSHDGSLTVKTSDKHGQELFPEQTWPVSDGHFKAMVMLSPGLNVLSLSTPTDQATITLTYIPPIQSPPLHLAVLVAKDSPLLVDCPPAKHGAISSAHANLDAAVAKLRMVAYMWQALVAEDLRAKGLGMRTFRLDEEFAPDTISMSAGAPSNSAANAMRPVPRVHIIRSELSVAELRDPNLAQQNSSANNRDKLHAIFKRELLKHGGVFDASVKPIVAGLILDSHYSPEKDLILGHAALGQNDPQGLSLGIFGSHLTYSWPRFIEEVSACLLDTRSPGGSVGNDNGQCASLWEAATVGIGAMLHEVGHAFGAPHTSGIMEAGYMQHLPKCFLSRTAYSARDKQQGVYPVTSETSNACVWDVRDALRFANLSHFSQPGDLAKDSKMPLIGLEDDDDFSMLSINSGSAIARVFFNGVAEPLPSISSPKANMRFTLDELEARFSRAKPLQVEVWALNGTHASANVWRLFTDKTYIRVPGTKIVLHKKSVTRSFIDQQDDSKIWRWAVMLKKRGVSGKMIRANCIDLRVGAGLDGAVVYYTDGTNMPCGPRWRPGGGQAHMGGHQSRKMALPANADITKVQVTTYHDSPRGLRMHLSTGKAMGALNKCGGAKVQGLLPDEGQRIVGFYGTSWRHGMVLEFGIITAPKELELPDSMYEMPELQNTDGGTGAKNAAGTDGEDVSEDEDGGYDYDQCNSEEED